MDVGRADMWATSWIENAVTRPRARRSVLEEGALAHVPSLAERDGTGNHLR